MKSGIVIALSCAFLLGPLGCKKESEGTKTSEGGKEKVTAKQSDTLKTSLTPQDRVKLALSVKDKEISLTGKERAKVETSKGTFFIEFYPDDAPNTVKNFIKLARVGFYDGLTFHRYVPDFVIQGGDPQGNGTGDAGYTIDAEFNKRRHETGAVGMARGTDPNSASCQFYITLSPRPHLDGNYTVFGRVVEGMDVVKLLRAGDTIKKITIE